MTRPKECFVAFVDILGFSEMIVRDGGTGVLLEKVIAAVNAGNRLLEERKQEHGALYTFWYQEFSVKSFSDCFCFSIPLEFDNGSKDYKRPKNFQKCFLR
jgi:hypothetical protein